MKKAWLCLFTLLTFLDLNAQIDTTSKVFQLEDLYRQMLVHHPITKRNNLITEIAEKELQIARGAFDPKLEADYLTKEFEEKLYYSYWNTALKVPVWIGELKAGYELNEGDLLSEENKSPKQGLMYAGISIPLGQDLLIDARRNTLRQAQYLQNIAEADRLKEINKLFLNATKAYWDWYIAYKEYFYLKEAFRLADERFVGVKDRVLGGDLAPIDSVEAKINVQDRLIRMRQAEVDVNNARLLLSNFLWGENETPLEIPEDALPQEFDINNRFLGEDALSTLVQNAQANHPEIIKLNFKLKQLEIEQRFARNRLLPRINLNYNFLTANPAPTSEFDRNYAANNYKFGFDFSIPLFLRKERGKNQQVRFKVSQTIYERTQVNRDIITNINTIYNDMVVLERNVRMQEDMVRNYEVLREGEYIKFQNGESSVFLINSRETKLIETQIKLASFRAKYEKEKASLRWAAGQMLWEE